jgi:SecD/SecF fusion protein
VAFIISTLLTVGFMLVFYTTGGVVAAVGMGVNVLITLGVMASIGATLTMPGIAGIVLTIGDVGRLEHPDFRAHARGA